MDRCHELCKQRNIKLRENNQLIVENSELSIKKIFQTNQVFSSTLQDQTESESFSLRLSESYVDETQESSKSKQNQSNEIIVISDSSSNESIFSYEPHKLINNKNIKTQIQKERTIFQSSEDESCSPSVQQTISRIEYNNVISKININKDDKKKIIIDESDSEIDQNKVSQNIEEPIVSNKISKTKEKEIMQWLLTNFNSSKRVSSCSQESIISNSRKSGLSSGNSSLERLELNFETPNNRGKLLKPNSIKKFNQINQKISEKQTSLKQYFTKSKKIESNIIKSKIYKSPNCDNIPIIININSKRLSTESELESSETSTSNTSDKMLINIQITPQKLIINKTEFKNSEIHRNKNFDKPSTHILKDNLRKKITPELKTFSSKSFINKNYDETVLNKIKSNFNKKLEIPDSFDSKITESSDSKLISNINLTSKNISIPESVSFDSNTSESAYFNKKTNNINVNLNKTILESDSFDSKRLESNNSDRTPILNTNKTSKKKTPSMSKHIDNNCFELNDHIDDCVTNNLMDKNKTLTNTPSIEISESINLKSNENLEPLTSLSDFKLQNTVNNKNSVSSTNTPTLDSTINDCADILENLYGKPWRDKATALIVTEPTKKSKKIYTDMKTKKSRTIKQSRYKWKSNSDMSDKDNIKKSSVKFNKTSKKSKNLNSIKNNSFINNDSTVESSPECSYYTALSNPISLQNNQMKNMTSSTTNINKKNEKKQILQICDSESEIDDENWKIRNNQRKLSFSTTSSSTSEFDPEDIVPPRTISKSIKIKKSSKVEPLFEKFSKRKEQDSKKSFLASLSKNVPLENAHFKAMIYRVKYNTMKEELCTVLFKLFNEHVFDNQLPNDMLIEWSTRLRGTAGKCYNKQSIKTFNNTVRSSRIVLATKILDSPDRLRDTLIHEMCHAATWLINNISDGHGSFWKAWANKAKDVFPELPPISRCHNYEIQTKYTYKCTTCGYNIGRHSKSLDLTKKRCGYCHGKFELLINKVTKHGKIQKKSSVQSKELSGFPLFVKENYQLVKQSKTDIKHGEIMKILGKQFSAIKITPNVKDSSGYHNNESP